MSKFKTETKQVGQIVWEIFVITPNAKFGAIIQCNGKPPAEAILEMFKQSFNQFFIEAESVLVKETMAIVKYERK